MPIYKKGPAFEPGNYRGVHLTTILSKQAEKMVGLHLVPHLRRYAFGTNQWAFSTGLSARDLVTMLVLSWILAVCTGQKVVAYLSDISEAHLIKYLFRIYLRNFIVTGLGGHSSISCVVISLREQAK